MQIKKGFVLREVCGEWVVSGESLEQINFNKLVTLNASAVFLWKQVENQEFDARKLADLLVEKYGIRKEVALHDALALCEQWEKADVIE